jgi:membrane-associated phospholipid phosphatase
VHHVEPLLLMTGSGPRRLLAGWVVTVAMLVAEVDVARAETFASSPEAAKMSPNPAAPGGPTANLPTAGGAPIAPPAPGAPAKTVEDAKKTAQAAELHPIVPSPRNPSRPAFQLYAEIDLPLLGIGTVFAGARLVRTQGAFCSPLCDRGTLNVLDRATAGYWNPTWQRASSVGLYAVAAGAAILLVVDEGPLPALNDSVVIAESALAGTAVASMLTLAASRPRPFLYGEKAALAERSSANGSLSFVSSHTTVSFAIAASSFMTMRRLHPQSKVSWVVLAIGGAAATFVGVGRVLGGMHFITDVAGGAIVGTSLGVLIPAMHGSPVGLVPVVGESQRGIALSLRF